VTNQQTLHPLKIASLQIIDQYWESLLRDQDFFNSEGGIDRILEEINLEEETREKIKNDISNYPNPDEAWQVLLTYKKGYLV
jgi:hypothetical protein